MDTLVDTVHGFCGLVSTILDQADLTGRGHRALINPHRTGAGPGSVQSHGVAVREPDNARCGPYLVSFRPNVESEQFFSVAPLDDEPRSGDFGATLPDVKQEFIQ